VINRENTVTDRATQKEVNVYYFSQILEGRGHLLRGPPILSQCSSAQCRLQCGRPVFARKRPPPHAWYSLIPFFLGLVTSSGLWSLAATDSSHEGTVEIK